MLSDLVRVFLLSCVALANSLETRSLASWRGDPCARAEIPWQPFTNHARLTPDAVARVITRSQHLQHLSTREHIHLQKGTEDVIVVRFDVLLSDDSLQTKVAMVQTGDDVALIIDGKMVGDSHRKQCVVATTNIFLPENLHHLIVDSDSASILIEHLTAKFDKLQLSTSSGGVDIEDSHLDVGAFSVDIKSGHFRLDASLEAETQEINISSGSIRGDFIASGKVLLRTNAGSIKCSLLESERGRKEFSAVDIHTESGSINLFSELKHNAEVSAHASAGSIKTSLGSGCSAEVHLETTAGSVIFPKDVRVTSESQHIPGHTVQGAIGDDNPSVVLDLRTRAGSIVLEAAANEVYRHDEVPRLSVGRLLVFLSCLILLVAVRNYKKGTKRSEALHHKDQTILKA